MMPSEFVASRLSASAPRLRADGERFLPGQMSGVIELEHLHRYRFAISLVAGLDVLDIACGEGYGSEMLSRTAKSVVGVDLADEAVLHASASYLAPNLRFRTGSCAAIPLAAASFDVVVSFETIEHHAEHEAMMLEFRRVLRPQGLLLISSPDKLEYADRRNFSNPYHVKELYGEEFQQLLKRHFRHVAILGQRVVLASVITGERTAGPALYGALDDASPPQTALPHPLYWLAIASDAELPPLQTQFLECALDRRSQETLRRADHRTAALLKLLTVPDSPVLARHLTGPWYLHENSDVEIAGIDPVRHWLDLGAAEGRLPAADPLALAAELLAERDARQASK